MIPGWTCSLLKVRVNRHIGTSRYTCHSLSVVVYLPNLLHGGACRTRNTTEAGAVLKKDGSVQRSFYVIFDYIILPRSHRSTLKKIDGSVSSSGNIIV